MTAWRPGRIPCAAHPFPDGNGRVARLAASFILMKSGYPPLILKASEGEAYVAAFQVAGEQADYQPLVRLVATALIRKTEDLLERIEQAAAASPPRPKPDEP